MEDYDYDENKQELNEDFEDYEEDEDYSSYAGYDDDDYQNPDTEYDE